MKRKKWLFAILAALLVPGGYAAVEGPSLSGRLGFSESASKAGATQPGWVVEYVDSSGHPIHPPPDSADTLTKATSGWRNWFAAGGSSTTAKVANPSSSSVNQCTPVPGSNQRR
jgi:hypothetical protein